MGGGKVNSQFLFPLLVQKEETNLRKLSKVGNSGKYFS